MKGNPREPGIIPLTLDYIFENFKNGETKDGKKITRNVTINYLEIYNETINDLLKHNNANLKLRMKADKSLYVKGLSDKIGFSSE